MTETPPPWWKATWPLDRGRWRDLATGFVGVAAVGTIVGRLLTDWAAPNAITELDTRVAEAFEANRTSGRNDLAHLGSLLSDTPVKIAASLVIVLAMLHLWRRWHDAAIVGLTLIFEACAFVTITFLVGRPRPDVERLVDSPVNSSFPSGHVAAATVYLALAIVVFWHTGRRWARVLAVGVIGVVPLIVALSRLYMGVHYLSDVIAGAVLGLTSLWICLRVLGAPDDPDNGQNTKRVHDAATARPTRRASIPADRLERDRASPVEPARWARYPGGD